MARMVRGYNVLDEVSADFFLRSWLGTRLPSANDCNQQTSEPRRNKGQRRNQFLGWLVNWLAGLAECRDKRTQFPLQSKFPICGAGMYKVSPKCTWKST